MADGARATQAVTARLWASVRDIVDGMVDSGEVASITEALNVAVKRGSQTQADCREVIAKAMGGYEEMALGIAVARIAGGIAHDVQATSYRASPEVFAEVRAAVNEFLDMIEPTAKEVASARDAKSAKGAAARVMAAVKRNLAHPERTYWPLGPSPEYIENDGLLQHMLPPARLLPLWASWAKRGV